VVVLLNPTIGFVQGSKAEASLDALRKMTTTIATVRRDGRSLRLDATELVPGDVVVLEAGDRIPADGRLLAATSLEVQEAALTGEAQSSAKSATAEVAEGAPLGDRYGDRDRPDRRPADPVGARTDAAAASDQRARAHARGHRGRRHRRRPGAGAGG
jgi:magnesium-transporting ATPase (P-type)